MIATCWKLAPTSTWRNCQTCRRPTRVRTSTYSSSSVASWLRKGYTVQDGRAHVRGHSWNCAVIRESTGSCRRSTWSTFPPLCSDQSSAGAVRETVYRTSAAGPSRSPDPPSGTAYRTMWFLLRLCRPSVSVWKHFCSRPRFRTLSSIPVKLFPYLQWILKWFYYMDHSKNPWLIDWLTWVHFLLDPDSADDGLVVLFTYDVVLCSRSVTPRRLSGQGTKVCRKL